MTYSLRQLLRKNSKFIWTATFELAFIKIKAEIASNQTLTPPDCNLPVILTYDASPAGIADILAHLYNGSAELNNNLQVRRMSSGHMKKKKNAEEPLITLALLELENSQFMEDVEIALRYPHPTSQEYLCQIITNITSSRTEQIQALIAEVENLSGTLASFKELDEIIPQTACQNTQTSPAPSCKETSSQTDPTKPATPSPADKPASTLPAPVATKRKQPEALNPPAKRPNLKGPTKLASSRVSKPAAAQVVLHGEKSAAHTVVVSDDPQADPRDIYKAVRAVHTLPQGVWASLRTKGKLVLHSSNPDIIPEVTTSLASKLTGMKVRQQKEILPRICLFRVDEETSNSTIEETFLATAAVSQLPGNKVVRVAHRSALRNGTCTAFIEVDLKTFGALGNRGRIVVDELPSASTAVKTAMKAAPAQPELTSTPQNVPTAAKRASQATTRREPQTVPF
ncbi:hypothetical protein LAZ67_12002604 [Cordylochernes scorpioides]|uniref:Reverse transcriptase/retrotransposon-derived protein RNase H-like domain-containing protein n=1 Tax=Cordylochernes scorpioides TaxID=51811 RepID=A0ABY6L6S4_9ARAC|nr:hypothetical protein LAZ67_12002604 [Cordylochernes scorpioides]